MPGPIKFKISLKLSNLPKKWNHWSKNAALVFKKPPTSLRKTRRQVFNIYVLEAWGENASSERVLDVYGELPHQQQFMIMTPSFQNHSELEFFIFLNQIVQSL